MNPRCPRCGNPDTGCISPGNQNYPAVFTCFNCNVYGTQFSEDTPGADKQACRAAAGKSVALSQANAAQYRRPEKP